MKSRLLHFATVLLGFAAISGTMADDTDIYVNNLPSGTEPMIMFAIDYRSSLFSTFDGCTGTFATTDDVASECGWDSTFTSYLTEDDLDDGKIQFFEVLRAGLRQVLEPVYGVKIGLMLNHNNSCTNNEFDGFSTTGCSNGGYILQGFQLLQAGDDTVRNAFHDKLAAIPVPQGNYAHPWQGKELYFEFFRYLTGQGIYNGHLGYNDFGDTDADTNLDGPDPIPPSPMVWDASIESDGDYISPLLNAEACAKIFVVNFLFNVSQQEGESDEAIIADKDQGGTGNPNLFDGNADKFDTMIDFLYSTDLADGSFGTAPELAGVQNVTSYFLVDAVVNKHTGYADSGGTQDAIEIGSDPEELVRTLRNVLNQILSVSTTFVSASIPVNVFNRSEVLDSVFLAIFEADEDGYPFWSGNLKKLQLLYKENLGTTIVADKNGNNAFAADGRINTTALTFWTDANAADVQNTIDETDEVGFDGRSVMRGGAGQQIIGVNDVGDPGTANGDGTRKLYTEPDDLANGRLALDADATTAALLWSNLNADGEISSSSLGLGIANASTWSDFTTYDDAANADPAVDDDETAVKLLKWIRGIDVNNEDGDVDGNGDPLTTDPRPWLLGDPIHSRPLPINYGVRTDAYSEAHPDIRVLMGTNQGFLHMFRNNESDGTESGEEVWAWMPRETMAIQKRLMDDNPSFPIHPYGLDGAPIALVIDANADGTIKADDDDTAWVYQGMRRGGKTMFALDITNPDLPSFMWKKSKTSSGFGEMGLTFSTPRTGFISYHDGTEVQYNQPVVIFGGGYDTDKDERDQQVGDDDDEGRAIYIVNAETGALIWKAVHGDPTESVDGGATYKHTGLDDSIPSDITAIDTNGDRLIDRGYVGDTGGNIWRLDLAGTNRSNWRITKLAALGKDSSGAGGSKRNDRRFFHRPDVVQSRDGIGDFDAVIIGSGDRANPLDKDIGNTLPENWLYMIKDRNTVSGVIAEGTTVINHGDLADLTDNCKQEVDVTCTDAQNTALAKGWRVQLEGKANRPGEKSLSTPLTLGGVIFYTTYIPPEVTEDNTSCGPSEGDGRLYALKLQDASAAINFNQANTVTQDGVTHELQEEDRYQELGSGIPPEVVSLGDDKVLPPGQNPIEVDVRTRWPTYWYQLGL